MKEITINLNDVMECMEKTFIVTIREMTNEKYTEEKEQEIKQMIKQALENSTNEAYVTAICIGLSEQMLSAIFPDD